MTILLTYLLIAVVIMTLVLWTLDDYTPYDLNLACQRLRITQGGNPRFKIAAIFGLLWPILAVAMLVAMAKDRR